MLYTLLHNNQIKVGPRTWHKGFFDRYLKSHNIQSDLPYDYSGTETIVINQDIKIVKTSAATYPPYNKYTEQLAGPTWVLSSNPIIGYYTATERNLIAAKNDIKQDLAAKRYEKENSSITVTIQNTEVQVSTHRDDRHIWFQSLILLSDNTTQRFKFTNDVWLDLTKTDIQSIVDAIRMHVQTCFAEESENSSLIDAAETKQEVETLIESMKNANFL